jgi:hypothetical protein
MHHSAFGGVASFRLATIHPEPRDRADFEMETRLGLYAPNDEIDVPGYAGFSAILAQNLEVFCGAT